MKSRASYPSYPALLNSHLPRKTPARKQQRHPLILFTVSGVIIIGMVVLSMVFTDPSLDEDLCWLDKPVPVHDVNVVDPTDKLSPVEVQALRRAVERRVAALKVGGRLTLAAIQPDGKGPTVRILFSRCKPRDGSKANILFWNRDLLRQQYHDEFIQPLEAAIQEIAGFDDTSTSPILSALYQIAASLPSFDPVAAQQRKLLVVSDLIEYSSTLKMYKPTYLWENSVEEPRIRAVKGRLVGVDVTVLLRSTPRTKPYHHKRHQDFWQQYMQHAGVTQYQILPL